MAANRSPGPDAYQGVVQVDGSSIRADAGKVDITGKHIIVGASEDQSAREHTLKESRSTWAFNTGLPTGQRHTIDAANQQSTQQGSTIAGAKGVRLTAPGVIDITASHLAATDGDIRIQGGAVSLQSGLDRSNTELKETYRKTGVDFKDLAGTFKPGEGVGFKSKLTKENAETTLAPTTLEAQRITLQSTAGDITLAAIDAHAHDAIGTDGTPQSGSITLTAAHNLNLDSVVTTVYQSTDMQKKDMAWQSVKGGGTLDETSRYTQLNAAQINLAAGSRITADMGVRDSAALLAQTPGMGWLKQLDDPALAGKIDWQSIEEVHKKWDYQQQGLTPAAAVVVAIVVAFVTAGAGTAALGTATTTAGVTTTTLGGVTLATTTAGVTSYMTAGVALNAAVTTLASQATVSLINNGGDLGQTLKELGSKDSLKQLAFSVVTAGVLNEVGQFKFGSGDTAFTLNSVKVGDGFLPNAGKNLVNGLARATLNSAITGTDLETNLKTEVIASLLSAGTAQGAKWVGDQTMKGGLFINDAGKVNEFGRAISHAIVGCMSGAVGASASGSNTSAGSGCGAGALGAVVGELSAGFYNSGRAEAGLLPKTDTVAFASMMSGIAAAATGQGAQGVAIAAGTGANAAENNRMLHLDERKLAAGLASKSQGKYTQAEIEDAMRVLGNQDKGENIATGMVVNSANWQTEIYDAGAKWSAGADGKTLVQVLPQVGSEVIAYVQQQTGGTASPYMPPVFVLPPEVVRPGQLRDPLTQRPLDDKGRYTVGTVVEGKVYEPKYWPCGDTSCLIKNANLDTSDPATQTYLRAMDKKI